MLRYHELVALLLVALVLLLVLWLLAAPLLSQKEVMCTIISIREDHLRGRHMVDKFPQLYPVLDDCRNALLECWSDYWLVVIQSSSF